MRDDLNVVVPEYKVLTIQGEDLCLSPVKIGQLREAMKSATAIIPFFKRFIETGSIKFEDVASNLDLIEPIILMITKKDKAWFNELNPLELVQIVCAIVEINFNFFFLNIIPTLTKTAEAMTMKISGQNPSRSL